MEAERTARRIRMSFVAMLAFGLALSFASTSIWLGRDGELPLDPDLQFLTYIRWANLSVTIVGWTVILLGVRDVAGRSKRGGPLRVTLGCWGIVLALNFVWVVLPIMAAESDVVPMMLWAGRLTTLVMGAGAVASIIHARDGGATSTSLGISGLGLLLYVLTWIVQEIGSVGGLGWMLGAFVLGSVSRIGLLGGMALLPWTPAGGAEVASEGVGGGLVDAKGSASTDFIVGTLFLGAGAAVTYLSFTGGGIGGQAVLAWGPMLYGGYRIVRGLTR